MKIDLISLAKDIETQIHKHGEVRKDVAIRAYGLLLDAASRLEQAEKDAARWKYAKENASIIFDVEHEFMAESGRVIYSTMPTRREAQSAIDTAMQTVKD